MGFQPMLSDFRRQFAFVAEATKHESPRLLFI
jgi:hypothetical protein